jgi:carbonic anhydrase
MSDADPRPAAGSQPAVGPQPAIGPQPRERLAVLTCMDTRINPYVVLGLQVGDAHIIRNAGGLVTPDAIRSLSVSQRLLNTTKIIVLMHDGCGLHGASDRDFAALLAADGASPEWRLGAFAEIEQALADGLRLLRSSLELPHRDEITAFIFDPRTGRVREPDINGR